MVSAVISRFVVLTAGTLYPAYRSYKAVRTKDVREYVKWMMYWIVFALFCFVETITDVIVSFWFPFYYELKIIFVFWLLSPWTKGASILYRKWVHPLLTKHEREIDQMLEQAKHESYNQVVRLGSRGLLCAREVIATAALKGQAQLVQQLQRSYSTSDINRRPLTVMKQMPTSEAQGEDDEIRIWEDDYRSHQIMTQSTATPDRPVDTIAEEDEEEGAVPPVTRRTTRASSRQRASPVDPSSEPIYNTLPRRSTRQH
uniref:Receptor expression-enhancing protein n=1 Tax=Ascaris suum TaxID=6253 RepID=F1LCU5_ASCSU